jgi:hypothetical protein
MLEALPSVARYPDNIRNPYAKGGSGNGHRHGSQMAHLLGQLAVDVREHYLAPRRQARIHQQLTPLIQLVRFPLTRFRPRSQATPYRHQSVAVQESRCVHEVLTGKVPKRILPRCDSKILYVCTAPFTQLPGPAQLQICPADLQLRRAEKSRRLTENSSVECAWRVKSVSTPIKKVTAFPVNTESSRCANQPDAKREAQPYHVRQDVHARFDSCDTGVG